MACVTAPTLGVDVETEIDNFIIRITIDSVPNEFITYGVLLKFLR